MSLHSSSFRSTSVASSPQSPRSYSLKDYSSLPQAPTNPEDYQRVFATALLPENQNKNRYRDVLPYEHSRVKLASSKGVSDYINASFITGAGRNKRAYIAAQAPLPATFDDFWLMIWENNVQLVLMLTRFQEKRVIKAHQYWPDEIDQELAFDEIRVCLLAVDEQPDQQFVVRRFRLSRDDDQRTLTHIHYTEWPDHGVPTTTANILALVGIIDESMRIERSPILIHCSAGIGRTGTIIALHIYLQKYQLLRNPKKISIYDIVEQMRRDRMGMVQTREQYLFLHNAVNDLIEKFVPKFEPVSPRKKLCHSMTISPQKLDQEETLTKLTRLRSLSGKSRSVSLNQDIRSFSTADAGLRDRVSTTPRVLMELPSSTSLSDSIGVVYGPDDEQI